jgi:hypothetical protein
MRSLAPWLIVRIDSPESSRTRLPVAASMNAIMSVVSGRPCSNSTPVYSASVFSRTITTSRSP